MAKQENFELGSTLGLRSLTRLITRRVLFTALAAGCAVSLAAQTGTLGTAFPLYVSEAAYPAQIVKVDSSGNQTVFTSGGNISYPLGLAFDASGNLYVAGNYSSNIVKVDISGNQTVFAGEGEPSGLAFDASGNLYAADLFYSEIIKVDSSGNQSVFTSGGNIYFPEGLAFDSSGNLYVASHNNSQIVKVDSRGNQSVFAYISSPFGLAFDASGNLYVASSDNNEIVKVDSNGNQTVFTSGGNISYPLGLAFDGSGNLYVVDGHGEIVKVDGNGNQTVLTSRGNIGVPRFLAFTRLAPASGSTCNGNYNATFKGNISVSAGQNCSFVGGGGITGNVAVNGGNFAITNGTISGNVQIQGAATVSLGQGTKINGSLAVQNLASGSPTNQICGAEILGNVNLFNNASPVQLGSASAGSCPGSLIKGNLAIANNTAAVTVFNNEVTKNLSCGNNNSITGGGNTAQSKQGQCWAF